MWIYKAQLRFPSQDNVVKTRSRNLPETIRLLSQVALPSQASAAASPPPRSPRHLRDESGRRSPDQLGALRAGRRPHPALGDGPVDGDQGSVDLGGTEVDGRGETGQGDPSSSDNVVSVADDVSVWFVA